MKFWLVLTGGFLLGLVTATILAWISELHFWGYRVRDIWGRRAK